jgi:hypothetical protein
MCKFINVQMKKVCIVISLLLSLLSTNELYAQKSKIKVTIHSRVDTSFSDVRDISMLWENYLNSSPDSIYNNPYWNSEEKQRYRDFDFSQTYLYQFPSKQLLRYYAPTILSIEKEGEYYSIRTIFAADNLPEEYRKLNPWSIIKLYAIKENGSWKLKNAISIITQNWSRKTIGKITFIYPPHHAFNEVLAQKANAFCEQLTTEFKFNDWKPFDFYITESADELGQLLNFDFFYAGYTTGIGMNENRILLSAFGSEYYPHEFIHLLVPNVKRHWMIEEGFATWKGGVSGKSFEESITLLANEIESNDTLTFTLVLNKQWGWQYAAYYTTGALFCKIAYERGGLPLLTKLMEIPMDDEKLVNSICELFQLDKKELAIFWRNEILKYKK